ncbi:hypothetical protein [Desulfosarcina cetonica]|uniref:hypothetical protein n=1 Tax=Desulfosarcina cetonica TaxID=90730 RepID=UPI001C436E3B|nr:hypothetical protein [Desulfosarcina cetonica]
MPDPSYLPARGLTRREVLMIGAMNLAGWLLTPTRGLAERHENDLALVAKIPGMAERETPLLIFREFMADSDGEVEAHIRKTLPQRQALLTQIRERFELREPLRFSVEEIEVRLMFVPQPELRQAVAYHRYCLDITDYLFAMNRMDNFYAGITAPKKAYPPIAEKGISAFIVHRLAKVYRAICRFSDESGRIASYRVSGAIFSNHLGAVDLDIEFLDTENFRMQRRPFTIWQSNCSGLFQLMAIPVEETLHYCLGHATDRQIKGAFKQMPGLTLAAAKQVADAWMSVEEALVGGLVDRVLQRYCTRYQVLLPGLAFTQKPTKMPDLAQYRYRRQGIELVRRLGFRRSIDMYVDHPAVFKAHLDDVGKA